MQNKPSNIQITSSKIQFTPPQTFKYHNELQKQSYIMKNNKNFPGPDCPGPNCPPWKSGKLGPGQLGPGNVPSQKQTNHQKTKDCIKNTNPDVAKIIHFPWNAK